MCLLLYSILIKYITNTKSPKTIAAINRITNSAKSRQIHLLPNLASIFLNKISPKM